MCDDILKVRPDVVITEKGVSDTASTTFLKATTALSSEESGKLTTIESQEFVEPPLSTDLKNSKKVMLELNAVSLKSRKLEMTTLHL